MTLPATSTTRPLDWIDPSWLDSNPSELEVKFARLWVDVAPEIDLYTEALIIPGRKFRFDFVHYPSQVAIEIQGYGPGHFSKPGVDRDNLKHRLAAEQGWLVFPIEGNLADDRPTLNRLVGVIMQRMLAIKIAS